MLGREGWLGCADCAGFDGTAAGFDGTAAGFDGAAAGALGGADLPLSPRMEAWRVSEPPPSEPRVRASPLAGSPTRPLRVPAFAESSVAGGAASTAVVSSDVVSSDAVTSDGASTVEVATDDDTIPERRLEMARILSSCECAVSPSNQAWSACSREYL